MELCSFVIDGTFNIANKKKLVNTYVSAKSAKFKN